MDVERVWIVVLFGRPEPRVELREVRNDSENPQNSFSVPGEVLRRVLEDGGFVVATVHTHPLGTPLPSVQDMVMAEVAEQFYGAPVHYLQADGRLYRYDKNGAM